MKIVFLQGAFEILNNGHVKCFKRAKSEGDYLIVALNSNRLLPKYKCEAVIPWHQKAEIIRSIKYVDKVVEAPNFSPLTLFKKYDVSVYMLGDEWIDTKAREIAYMKKKGGKVVILPRYKKVVCTSEIKRLLLKEASEAERFGVS